MNKKQQAKLLSEIMKADARDGLYQDISKMETTEPVTNGHTLKAVDIVLDEYMTTCSDGCCTSYGMTTIVNGTELLCRNEDVETILTQLLEHLGYKVNIKHTYNGK